MIDIEMNTGKTVALIATSLVHTRILQGRSNQFFQSKTFYAKPFGRYLWCRRGDLWSSAWSTLLISMFAIEPSAYDCAVVCRTKTKS